MPLCFFRYYLSFFYNFFELAKKENRYGRRRSQLEPTESEPVGNPRAHLAKAVNCPWTAPLTMESIPRSTHLTNRQSPAAADFPLVTKIVSKKPGRLLLKIRLCRPAPSACPLVLSAALLKVHGMQTAATVTPLFFLSNRQLKPNSQVKIHGL